MKYDKLLIRSLMKSLPDEITDHLGSDEMLSLVEEIQTKENLKLDQAGDLDSEITYRLLGLTPKSSFTTSIETRLNIPSEKASKIGGVIEEKLNSLVPLNISEAQEEYAQTKLKEFNSQPHIIDEAIFTAEELKSISSEAGLPEIAPNNLPMVEEGEVAHDVSPSQTPPNLPTDNNIPETLPSHPANPDFNSSLGSIAKSGSSYADGKDPYREPIE